MAPKVLMVAEKPSIALSIASVLSGGQMSTRRGSTDVHEFDGMFLGSRAQFRVTSVIGHVFSVDFPASYQDWASTEPLSLFQAPIRKAETNPKIFVDSEMPDDPDS
nr:DNA topoisomerase 3-beta isoform X1 [Ipomoea trifida]